MMCWSVANALAAVLRPWRDDWNFQWSGRELAPLPMQLARSQLVGNVRPTEGPAAPERQVESEIQLMHPVRRKAQVGKKASDMKSVAAGPSG